MIRAFVVAPTQMMRAGLRAMLTSDDIEVVGEASALVGLLTAPDGVDALVVDGESLVGNIGTVFPDEQSTFPALVILSDDPGSIAALQALPVRGWGVVSPDAQPAELQATVQAAAQGLVTLPVALANQAFVRRDTVQALGAEALAEALTVRELDVLNLLSQGLSNKLIARRLNISEHTVKFHVSSIYTKLGAASRTEAVSRGARLGLISF